MRHLIWSTLLVGAGIGLSLGFACAIPFAGFAAAAALTLPRRDALALILAVWLANQIVGFTALGYPLTADTFEWGAALGVVAVLATLAAQWAADRLAGAARAVGFAAVLLLAFAVYEAGLLIVSMTWLGGAEVFTAAIQGRIFAINAGAFVILMLLSRLATVFGLVLRSNEFSLKERHA
jgi:hypothetical protein